MERTYDEEIHKRINHSLRGRICEKERSESSEYVLKTMGFLHRQNTNSFGDIF